MALQKSYTDDYGVVHAEAYHVINDISFAKMSPEFFNNVAIYHNKQARDDGHEAMKVNQYKASAIGTVNDAIAAMDGGQGLRNYIYDQLKLLPEYEGAIDV